MMKSKYQIDIVVSTMVLNELEGLTASKKEKTAASADEALEYITNSQLRYLTNSGKLIPGLLN